MSSDFMNAAGPLYAWPDGQTPVLTESLPAQPLTTRKNTGPVLTPEQYYDLWFHLGTRSGHTTRAYADDLDPALGMACLHHPDRGTAWIQHTGDSHFVGDPAIADELTAHVQAWVDCGQPAIPDHQAPSFNPPAPTSPCSAPSNGTSTPNRQRTGELHDAAPVDDHMAGSCPCPEKTDRPCTLHPEIVSDAFRRVLARTGLPPISLRDLRHVSATLQHAGGGDLHTIKEVLRHSTITLTSDTYTSLLPEVDHEVAGKAARHVPRARRAAASRTAAPASG